MVENKVERAIRLLREAADALEEIPPTLRRNHVMLGHMAILSHMRSEADHLETIYPDLKIMLGEIDGLS